MRSVLLACFLAACGSNRESKDAGRTPRAEKSSKPQVRRRVPARTPHELPLAKREVRIQTPDGVEIGGWLWPSRDPTKPAILCVHQLGKDRREWEPFVDALRARSDVSILAIDLRGHGASVKKGDARLAYRRFSDADWRGTVEDVRAALAFLQEGSGLRPTKVGVVGSSIGSSAALIAAADDATVNAVALVSPGLAYHRLDTLEPARRFGRRPMLLVATEGDTASAEATDALSQAAERADRQFYREGDAHGLAIAEESSDLFPRMATWLLAKLGIRPPSPSPGG